jgi:hypothetical protein
MRPASLARAVWLAACLGLGAAPGAAKAAPAASDFGGQETT